MTDWIDSPKKGTRLALKRAPSTPGPQAGEKDGHRTLDYAQDVQPVLDRYCQKCHSGADLKGKLNLSGEMTELFNVTNWVDTNGQYYGSWWGRRNLKYKGMPDFRPLQTFEMATTNINPYPSRVEK